MGVRDRKYIIICPSCANSREVCYAQKNHIDRGICSSICMSCNGKASNNKGKFKKGQPSWNKGNKGFLKGHPPYFIAFGEDNPAWRGGITSKSAKIRNSKEYAAWRTQVFERDLYTCQHCNQIGGKLHADHIIPFCIAEDLRLDINNGRTLCIDCHKKTDTYLSKAYKIKIEKEAISGI